MVLRRSGPEHPTQGHRRAPDESGARGRASQPVAVRRHRPSGLRVGAQRRAGHQPVPAGGRGRNLFRPSLPLGLADVQPDFLGRAYEYLLRKFAEGSGRSSGEFFTPTEVGFLMAHILRPRPRESCHDYACGSAGLLVKLQLAARELDPTSRVPPDPPRTGVASRELRDGPHERHRPRHGNPD